MVVLLLTYTVAAWDTSRRAALGLGFVYLTLVVLGFTDTPGLDTLGVVGNIAIFTVAWTVGIALRARRDSLESRVREAEERANVERQTAARALAEERLRIAQELHDVVAHSMSVIAVQAGVGAHVLDARPDEARAALEAISHDVPRHAHRDAAAARRAARRRRRALATRRRPASPTCRGSSRMCTRRAFPSSSTVTGDPPTAWPPASTCRPTGSCRRRSPT